MINGEIFRKPTDGIQIMEQIPEYELTLETLSKLPTSDICNHVVLEIIIILREVNCY